MKFLGLAGYGAYCYLNEYHTTIMISQRGDFIFQQDHKEFVYSMKFLQDVDKFKIHSTYWEDDIHSVGD